MERITNYVKNISPELFLECKQYMRHKTILINPYALKEKIPDIKIKKLYY